MPTSATEGYFNNSGAYVLSLHDRIAKYIFVDGKPGKTPLSQHSCWFWNGPLSRSKRSNRSLPRPVLRYNGKLRQPFRHFFPDMDPSIHLTKASCGDRGTICVNPHHRVPPANQVFDSGTGFWYHFDRAAFLRSCIARLGGGEITTFAELKPKNTLERDAIDWLLKDSDAND